MNRDHVPLTEAEWKIMLLLWEKSPRTMMELTRALAEDTGWSKHTVITMLKRMAVKGTVRPLYLEGLKLAHLGLSSIYLYICRKLLQFRQREKRVVNAKKRSSQPEKSGENSA